MSGAYWALPHLSQDWPEVPLDRKWLGWQGLCLDPALRLLV